MQRRIWPSAWSCFLYGWHNRRSNRKSWKNGKRCSCLISNLFNIDIVNPEQSFLSKDNVFEVVIPAVEGEIGILKDHIPIISFLKPGIIRVFSESEEQSFYVEDGIVEFKDNTLSVLTSSIFDLKDADKNFVSESISSAEAELSKDNIDDQKRFLLNHKVEVLKSISIN